MRTKARVALQSSWASWGRRARHLGFTGEETEELSQGHSGRGWQRGTVSAAWNVGLFVTQGSLCDIPPSSVG